MPLHLTYIAFYPIKSTRRVELDEARVLRGGLSGDRRWMVVDEAGTFISQRTEPRLALVRAATGEGGVMLAAPGMEPLDVRFPRRAERRVNVRIWNDDVDAQEAETPAAEWFSEFLGRPVKLVYMDDGVRRRVDSAYAVSPEDHVTFADAFPVLLASVDSLGELNRRLDSPVPMTRFRPNLVVAGAEPFAEDAWRRIRIGTVEFVVAKGCARCTVTTIDQETAEAGKEPLRTLNRFRKRDGKVFFGRNMIPAEEGVVRRGDPVHVLE